jgi:hypothetical protein
MKKLILSTLSLAVIVIFSGCSMKGSFPSQQTYDLTKIDFSKSKEWKKGTSCSGSILFIIPTGISNSIKYAAEEAGISKVAYTEMEENIFFPFYSEDCVTVYGE